MVLKYSHEIHIDEDDGSEVVLLQNIGLYFVSILLELILEATVRW